ncbi:elongation factor 4 [bacterium]|nr:elongation factor 4 [bacterium]
MQSIRNFSIIAHIDHGKSTLADRLIQYTGVIPERDFRDQVLDSMDIERERGITIKSQAISLPYKAMDGKEYCLNLIDTPGHVDFSYEVSRSLAACEGVLLVIDAAQGVEAQTLANLYLALELNLEIIPVINKIDLPSADVEKVLEEIDEDLGLNPDLALKCSAKEGVGIREILEAIVMRIPPPKGDNSKPLSALVFDAQYDSFRGVVVHCRLFDGQVRIGDIIRFMSTNADHKVEEVGHFLLNREKADCLSAGEVGYIIAGIKEVRDARCGDTVTLHDNPCSVPLPGFREAKPVVFSSIYSISTEDYEDLADSLEKYRLNDAALVYEKDSSAALGPGFRGGFLGLLHLEIVQERLEREFGLSILLTAPSVRYRLTLKDGREMVIENPSLYPDPATVEYTYEPFIKAAIIMPERYLGAVMKLCLDRRGVETKFHYSGHGRVELTCELPLAEVIFDFYDQLKTITQGYGSFDYEMLDYRQTDIVKLDILVNGEKVDALSQLVHRDKARARALHACERLKEEIPRHMFKIPIQGSIGNTIIARSTISPFRKDVIAKCYGGDITRKRKLLEKQKKGKKRMKIIGSVSIPQSAFIAVLKADTDKK